jgi:putative redox protein
MLTGVKEYHFLNEKHWIEDIIMKSTSRLVDGMTSVVDNGRSHSVVVDLPREQDGTDLGATALELAVMALSGCITTIFSVVAGNSKLTFQGITVDIDAEKSQETGTVNKLKITGTVTSDETEAKVGRVFEKTMKTCPVGILFEKAGVEVESELNVVS